MGAPIRSNIFHIGSEQQRYFASFPVQVAVLFSPTDNEFSDALKDLFVHLDRLTGDNVVFFALLDPPQDWIDLAERRAWWREYNKAVPRLGFSYDNRPLVNEIAQQFQVDWSELPALVVSTNLWSSESFVTPTSSRHIEHQLVLLTELVDEWKEPSIGQMIQHFQEQLAADTRYNPPSDQRRFRLDNIYGVIQTYDPDSERLNVDAFRRYLEREQRQIDFERPRPVRASRSSLSQSEEKQHQVLFATFADDSARRLIAPATVALRAFDSLNHARNKGVIEGLDEESIVMIEAALTIGDFLEGIDDGRVTALRPLRFSRTRDQINDRFGGAHTDFTPGAQGVWKAFEREINLSIIQVARYSRGIRMPDFFGLFDENFPKDRSAVQAGNRRRNLNVRDPRNSSHHEFFELGPARYITTGMLENQTETLAQKIGEVLGTPLPNKVLDDWQTILDLRNKGSHSYSVSRTDYKRVLSVALDMNLLSPLVRLKRSLFQC